MQFRERVQSFERQLILGALRETGWNRTRAAKLLGMPIRTLTHKIRMLDLRPGDEE